VELGAQLVGTVSYRHVTIGNDGLCDVWYRLLVQQFISGPYSDDQQLENDRTPLGISLHSTDKPLQVPSVL